MRGRRAEKGSAVRGSNSLPFDLWTGRRRASGLTLAAKVAGALLSSVILLVSGSGWALLTYANGRIDSIDLDLGDDGSQDTPGATNFLLVGTDSRAGAGGEFGDVGGQRSDSTVLAHLGADNVVTLISFPRDTYVTIPEYTDADGEVYPPHKNKFNYAISVGGPSLLVQMVKDLTGMGIDHYISVDLVGFRDIADAIGGVEVCIQPSDFSQYVEESGRRSSNVNDPMSGFVGGPGQVTLDGDMALAFVRQRFGLPNWDLDRAARQQQFLGAVFRKISGGGVLTNPVQLERLLSAATGALTFDDNTDILDLRSLATRLGGMGSDAVRSVTLPTHTPTRAENAVDDMGGIRIPGVGVSQVQFYDPEDLEAIVGPLGGRVEEAYTEQAQQNGPLAVRVFNGTAIGGLAARVTTDLTAAGISATNAGNAATSDYVTTRILYGPGEADAAQALAARLPTARVGEDSSVEGVQVIVGSSYDGLAAPQPTPGTGPGTTAATPPDGAGEPGDAPAPAPPAQPPAPNCTY